MRVRTPCSWLHLSSSAWLSAPACAGSVAISLLLVGSMTSSVYGQLAISTTAPNSQSQFPLCHHANNPSRKPTTASGACMAKPRL